MSPGSGASVAVVEKSVDAGEMDDLPVLPGVGVKAEKGEGG